MQHLSDRELEQYSCNHRRGLGYLTRYVLQGSAFILQETKHFSGPEQYTFFADLVQPQVEQRRQEIADAQVSIQRVWFLTNFLMATDCLQVHLTCHF